MIQLKIYYEGLTGRYGDLEETSKTDFDSMKINYDNVIGKKDKLIVSQRKTIDARYVVLQSAEERKTEYERLIAEAQNEEIMSQNNNEVGVSAPCSRLNKISNMDEIFRMKPKKKGSAKNIQLMCNNPSYEAVNVDLIRCNICTKYV